MKVFLVDGVFTLIGCYMITDPRDDFIRHATVDRMMARQVAFTLPASDDEKRRTLLETDNQYSLRIQHYGGVACEHEVISKTYFKNSAPGYIYLVDRIEALRRCNYKSRVLILLKDPAQDMYLDITINPRNFGYGLELPDTGLQVVQPIVSYDESYMAWLAVEPGICNPLKIEPVEYVNRNYLHHMVYQ